MGNKNEKTFWKKYFDITNSSLAPEKIHRLAWKDQSITDQELEFLSIRVKDIYQMDLDDNPISNKGIENLTRFNYIEELRLKGLYIDNDAIPFIKKIPGLKLLHLGGTNISSEGISELSAISTLETLICTLDPIDPVHLIKFKESLPGCELIVNYEVFEG